jgi:hypothetical protein
LVDWARDSFYQGENLCYDKELARQYIRSASIYDQFATCGHFDIIWLSDQVRSVYTHIHASKLGMSEEKERLQLERQLAENEDWIVFYLISSVETLFADPLSEWSVYLQIGESFFEPADVKVFDIGLEYKAFFGKRYNRFRTPYRIAFHAKGPDCVPFLSLGEDRLFIHLESLQKKTIFEWRVHNHAQILYEKREECCHENCHRC